MGRGAWLATVPLVVKSWTRLKQLRTHAHLCLIYEGRGRLEQGEKGGGEPLVAHVLGLWGSLAGMG